MMLCGRGSGVAHGHASQTQWYSHTYRNIGLARKGRWAPDQRSSGVPLPLLNPTTSLSQLSVHNRIYKYDGQTDGRKELPMHMLRFVMGSCGKLEAADSWRKRVGCGICSIEIKYNNLSCRRDTARRSGSVMWKSQYPWNGSFKVTGNSTDE